MTHLICHKFNSKRQFDRADANPGASCSKLTTSLLNDLLKFQTLILQIHCYFLLKKLENPLHCKGFSHFSTKNNSVFVTLADICLKNLCLNDIVKLTML